MNRWQCESWCSQIIYENEYVELHSDEDLASW
jgi:hypothetical protein